MPFGLILLKSQDTIEKGSIMLKLGNTGNVIAALCNVFIPGLGQLIQGRLLLAIIIFCAVTVGYWFWWFFIFPAVIGGLIHLLSILSAATYNSDN
jgi:TM2 domain-containing membrane protein YozV